ncbi:MAG: hypothetical protein RSB00_03515 [Bacilli bacterium]
MNDISKLNLPKLDLPIIDLPKIDINFPTHDFRAREKEIMDEIYKANQDKLTREIENNESLKMIVDYNGELVSLNNQILKKINSLNDTLTFLNNVFNDKSEFDKEKAIEKTAMLLELVQIIEEKDNNKLEKFMSNVGAPLSVGLLIEYFKMKLGLS